MVPRPPIGALSPMSDSLPLYSEFHPNHVSDRKRNQLGIRKKQPSPKEDCSQLHSKRFFMSRMYLIITASPPMK